MASATNQKRTGAFRRTFFCPPKGAGRHTHRVPRTTLHQLIYALVEAPSRDDALASGNAAFDRLVGVGSDTAAVFDYYVTFDDETASVAGTARWGELPVVASINAVFVFPDGGNRV